MHTRNYEYCIPMRGFDPVVVVVIGVFIVVSRVVIVFVVLDPAGSRVVI